MSTPEPPAGSTPPPGEPTPPPPAAGTPPPPAPESAPPPPNPGTVPPPPPPPAGAAAPAPGAAPSGVGQPGSLLDRFLARLIDMIIVGVVVAIINGILTVAINSYFVASAIAAVVAAVAFVGYFGYMESNRGQTIGKQVLKLRTYGPDRASNPTMEEAVRRNIWLGFGIVGVIPIIGPIVGGLAELAAVILIAVNINSDPQRQHWFDKFAGGTQVMKVG